MIAIVIIIIFGRAQVSKLRDCCLDMAENHNIINNNNNKTGMTQQLKPQRRDRGRGFFDENQMQSCD